MIDSPTPAPTPLVRLQSVGRSFGVLAAVDSVSFDIHDNEFFALLGPSGCGKTTLLRILAGLETADGGSVTLDGADLLAMPAHRRPVNLMFQSYALFPHLTVGRNVGYGLAREKRPRAEIRARVAQVLDVVGLADLAERKPAQLSGGQRQRVALARAMVKRPRLLLLDEPLAALDRKIRAQMQSELKRLQHEVGITFVIVTHDQEEAMSMADRIAVMNAGRVEQLASPTTLYERPATRFVADFIGSTNMFDGVVADDRTGVVLPTGTLAAAEVGDRTEGSPVSASLRPEKVRCGGDPSPGAAVHEGRVRDVQFFGGVSHTMVDVAGFERPLVAAGMGAATSEPGDDVCLWWHPADVVIVDPSPTPAVTDTRVPKNE